MELWLESTVPQVLVACLVLGLLLLMARPLGYLIKLLFRTGAGLAVLAVFSQVGGLIGITLGTNLLNALVLAVLGVPGFGLLLLLNWSFLAM